MTLLFFLHCGASDQYRKSSNYSTALILAPLGTVVIILIIVQSIVTDMKTGA